MSSMVNTGSTKQHMQRQLRTLSERTELELLVACTEVADLERAVFKATKNNTKSPKEKHVQFIINAINSQRLSGTFRRTVPKARGDIAGRLRSRAPVPSLDTTNATTDRVAGETTNRQPMPSTSSISSAFVVQCVGGLLTRLLAWLLTRGLAARTKGDA